MFLLSCVLQNSTVFIEEIDYLKETFGYQTSTPYCFDATWTLAYALNRALNGEFKKLNFVVICYCSMLPC